MPTVAQIEALVGLPYEEGRFDCAHFVARTQRELFGRDVVFPGHHPQGIKTGAAAIRRHAGELATRIEQGDAMDGDAVLMVSGGHLHIGTLLFVSGMSHVLHNSATIGHSILQRLDRLPAFGLKIEGFYRWK